MMGRRTHDQEQFFYSFRLDEAVPDDHPVREIAAVLDLSWVHSELAPYYPRLGRLSIDPVLMIRMLIIGYGEGFAVDASLIAADANKQRSTPGSRWNKELDPQAVGRATKEYLARLDDAAFGAASNVLQEFAIAVQEGGGIQENALLNSLPAGNSANGKKPQSDHGPQNGRPVR